MTDSNNAGIEESIEFFEEHFVTKDLEKARFFFFGIEIAHRKNGVALSQRKYILDLLLEKEMLGCKHEKTSIDTSLDLWDESFEMLEDVGWYRRLVGKLIYLTVTRLDITIAVGVIS